MNGAWVEVSYESMPQIGAVDTAKTVRERLAQSSSASLTIRALAAAFSTYFCMYAFRKPFWWQPTTGSQPFRGFPR